MPTVTLRDNNTGEEWEVNVSIAEKEEFLTKNPHIEQIPVRLTIGDSVRLGVKKPDSWFQNKLRSIKKNHRGTNINAPNITEC